MRKINEIGLSEFLRILTAAVNIQQVDMIQIIVNDYKIRTEDSVDERTVAEWFNYAKSKSMPRKLNKSGKGFLIDLINGFDNTKHKGTFLKDLKKSLSEHNFDVSDYQEDLDKLANDLASSVLDSKKYHKSEKIGSNPAQKSPIQSNRLTKLPVYTDTTSIIHRETDINNIIEMLSESHMPVCISGIGGIGKSSLARILLYSLEDSYDYIGWINYDENLQNSLCAQFLLFKKVADFGKKIKSINKFFEDRNHHILLVIDNVNKQLHQDDYLETISTYLNVSIIITTRMESLAPYRTYRLQPMKKETAVDLFIHYYNRSADDKHAVSELTKYADGHPYFIELLAKAAQRETSLENMVNKLHAGGLKTISRKIQSSGVSEPATISDQIKVLFNLNELTPDQMKILILMAHMQQTVIPYEFLHGLSEQINWSDDDLEMLIRNGWISSHTFGFYLSPILRERILMESPPAEFSKNPFNLS